MRNLNYLFANESLNLMFINIIKSKLIDLQIYYMFIEINN